MCVENKTSQREYTGLVDAWYQVSTFTNMGPRYLRVSAFTTKNGRSYMEDRFKVCKNISPGIHVFGVFDGHGGDVLSDALATHFTSFLENRLIALVSSGRSEEEGNGKIWEVDPGGVVLMALKDVDDMVLETGDTDSGSTACVVMLRESENDVTVVNVGDSRAIMQATGDGVVRRLSVDHKPGDPAERARIEREGGFVMGVVGVERTMGVLSLSRSLGDWKMRPFVSPEPQISTVPLPERGGVFVLATDGLWDVVGDDEAATIVNTAKAQHRHYLRHIGRESCVDLPMSPAKALVTEALKRGSTDNITALCVDVGLPSLSPT